MDLIDKFDWDAPRPEPDHRPQGRANRERHEGCSGLRGRLPTSASRAWPAAARSNWL